MESKRVTKNRLSEIKMSKIDVKAGELTFGQRIEILTGVASEDRVILNPSESLTTGATVSISGSIPK